MKAQVIEEFGTPDVFKLVDLPNPTPGPDEVIVRVSAVGINPLDCKVRAKGHPFAPKFPAVLGCDAVGTIAEVGSNVTAFAVGDEVYGVVGGVPGMEGALAELVRTDPSLLALKPKNLTMAEAAALPIIAITAWEGLVDRARIKEGDEVLVLGGTGGVGHIVIQLAKALGARVTATVSNEEKGVIAKELGADEIVNRLDEEVQSYVDRVTAGRGFNIVFDTSGMNNYEEAFTAARPNGHVITIISYYEVDLTLTHKKGLSLHAIFMLIPQLKNFERAHQGKTLSEISALVEANKIKPLIDGQPYEFANVAGAHARIEEGGVIGKVVVNVL